MFFVALQIKAVVEEKFFVLFDVSNRTNPDSTVHDVGFAIRGAGVIDQTSGVYGNGTVDVPVVIQSKNINRRLTGLLRPIHLSPAAFVRLRFVDLIPHILNDVGLVYDVFGGVKTSAMNRRPANITPFGITFFAG